MTRPYQPPLTEPEWVRETERRLRRLEAPAPALRIGEYTIAAVDGQLILIKPGTNGVALDGTQPEEVNLSSLRGQMVSVAQDVVSTSEIPAENVTGIFDQNSVDGLREALLELNDNIQAAWLKFVGGGTWQELLDNIWKAMFGGTTSGHGVADMLTALQNIPGLNIVSLLLASIIPGLDASKIITGQFAQSMVNITSIAAGIVSGVLTGANIPGLDAAKIVSGIFGTSVIPSLDAAKIVSGLFGAARIPGLDTSKIISGVFGLGVIPSLPTSQITSGVFGAGFIPGIDTSKIISGTFGEQFIPALPSLRDVLFNGVSGFGSGAGWTNTNVTSALTDQRNTIAAQAAEIAELKGQNSASQNSGVWDYDDFNWWSGSAAAAYGGDSVFAVGSATQGSIQGNGSQLYGTNGSPAGDWEQHLGFNWSPCLTDYIHTQTVYANSFAYRNDGLGDDREVRMYHYGRLIPGFSQWTRWRLRMNPSVAVGVLLRIEHWNGTTLSVGTELNIGSIPSGASVETFAGVGANLRQHQFAINGAVVKTENDSSNIGPVGATARNTGIGVGYHANNLFALAPNFPVINYVIWSDNQPVAKVGCGGTGWRTSTAQVTATVGATTLVNQSFFQSSDVTNMGIDTNWNHGFYPTKKGWYLYEATIKGGSGWPDGVRLRLQNWTGSVMQNKEILSGWVQRGVGQFGGTILNGGIHGVTIFYCDPDDVNNNSRYLAYDATGASTVNSFTGEGTGLETVCKVTFLNDRPPG